MLEYKEATSVQLAQIAAEGDAMGLNRQIAEWVIAEIDPACVLLVSPLLIHEHAQGRRVDPHVRTRVLFRLRNGVEGSAFVDMSFAAFDRLPKLRSRTFDASRMTTAQKHRFRRLQRAFRKEQLWVGWADDEAETANDLIVEDDHPDRSESTGDGGDLLTYVIDGSGTPKSLAKQYASSLRQYELALC